MEKTQDGVWLKRDFPSAVLARGKVLLLEETMEQMLKSVDDVILAARQSTGDDENAVSKDGLNGKVLAQGSTNFENVAESPKPEVEIDEKNVTTKVDENVNKSKNDSLTESEAEEDEFLVNYKKFPKLLEEVKEKQNVYNAYRLKSSVKLMLLAKNVRS